MECALTWEDRPAIRMVQLLQQDLLKDAASMQFVNRSAAKNEIEEDEETKKLESQTEEMGFSMRRFLLYIHTLMQHGTHLLESAMDANDQLRDTSQKAHLDAGAKLDNPQEGTNQEEKLSSGDHEPFKIDCRVGSLLEQGVLFQILKPLATALCIFVDDSSATNNSLVYSISSSLLHPLISLLKALGT